MGNWMTADEIARNYVVGEERLLSYGQRGNLAFRRCEGGAILYDELGVARFFRKRHGRVGVIGTTFGAAGGGAGATSIGVLGTTRLGEEPPRSTRRRSGPHELRVGV